MNRVDKYKKYAKDIFEKRLYLDNNKDYWFIYKHTELVCGEPSICLYVQKCSYGDMIFVCGCEPDEYSNEIEIYVNNYIESVKDDPYYYERGNNQYATRRIK